MTRWKPARRGRRAECGGAGGRKGVEFQLWRRARPRGCHKQVKVVADRVELAPEERVRPKPRRSCPTSSSTWTRSSRGRLQAETGSSRLPAHGRRPPRPLASSANRRPTRRRRLPRRRLPPREAASTATRRWTTGGPTVAGARRWPARRVRCRRRRRRPRSSLRCRHPARAGAVVARGRLPRRRAGRLGAVAALRDAAALRALDEAVLSGNGAPAWASAAPRCRRTAARRRGAAAARCTPRCASCAPAASAALHSWARRRACSRAPSARRRSCAASSPTATSSAAPRRQPGDDLAAEERCESLLLKRPRPGADKGGNTRRRRPTKCASCTRRTAKWRGCATRSRRRASCCAAPPRATTPRAASPPSSAPPATSRPSSATSGRHGRGPRRGVRAAVPTLSAAASLIAVPFARRRPARPFAPQSPSPLRPQLSVEFPPPSPARRPRLYRRDRAAAAPRSHLDARGRDRLRRARRSQPTPRARRRGAASTATRRWAGNVSFNWLSRSHATAMHLDVGLGCLHAAPPGIP